MSDVSKIPKTMDGQIIYPGMKVFICSPYSTVKAIQATVYCVIIAEDNPCLREYWVVLQENRYLDGDHWDNGNTEHVTVIFEDEGECLKAANAKWAEFDRRQKAKGR